MRWIYLLVAVMFLLAACGQKQVPDYEVKDEMDILEPEVPVEMEAVVQPDEEPEAAPEPSVDARRPPSQTNLPSERPVSTEMPPAEPKVTDPELKGLLKLADDKVKSYSFLYGGPETGGIFKNTYNVKGDKVWIKLYEENYYVRDSSTDIWLDGETKTAVGCCVGRRQCLTPEADYSGKMYNLTYVDIFLPRTPYQWLKEIKENAKVVGHETFNERTVTTITYDLDDGSTVHMKIDETYGLPHQVVITKGESQIGKYQFNDLKFNSLKDSDFVPPCV